MIDTHDTGDNLSINLGERDISMSIIELAHKIHAHLQQTNKGADKATCELFNKSRAQIYDLDTLATIDERILYFFINGYIGMKPLVDLYRVHGLIMLGALKHLASTKEATGTARSKKVTKKEILSFIKPTVTGCHESTLSSKAYLSDKTADKTDSTTPVHNKQPPMEDLAPAIETSASINTTLARLDLMQIRRVLNECSECSQIGNGAYIPNHDMGSIIKKLNNLEQWLDELNPDEAGEQGDPLDQTNGSYVFENMVNSPPVDDQCVLYFAPEDENQDIQYQ